MRNLVFLLVCLFSCDVYTVKNSYKEDILAGEVIINATQCVEFFDFPLIGDFPIRFKYKDPNHLISDKFHPPGHYEISKSGAILKKKSACPIDIVGPKNKEQLKVLLPEKLKKTEPKKQTPTKPEPPDNRLDLDKPKM